MIKEFELEFELPELSESAEDRLVDATDGVVGVHGGVTTVIMGAAGSDFMNAVALAAREIRECGVAPKRLVPDLVSRSEIALRAGVTRQAVANWVNGRRQGNAFPSPYVLSGGGMWLWSEVAEALRGFGIAVDEELSQPSRVDVQRACALVATESFYGVGRETPKETLAEPWVMCLRSNVGTKDNTTVAVPLMEVPIS